MFKNLKLSTKVSLGFALMSALLIVLVLVTITKIHSVEDINKKVINLRAPTVMSSIEMINGVNHSLAALRGWIILEKDVFKVNRKKAWSEEIEHALKDMTKFSENWTNPQNIQRLKSITLHLKEFKKYQKEIEDMAHHIDNEPALKLLFKEAAPEASIMIKTITSLIDLELQQKGTTQRKELLGMMADVRGTTGLALASIRAYLLSNDEKFKDSFHTLWEKNTKRFNQLSNNSALLTSEQKAAFTKFSKSRDIFTDLPDKMFKIRSSEDWNIANKWLGTKAAPTAFKIKTNLEAMIKNQKSLMKKDTIHAHDASESLITLEWILLLVGILLSITISLVIRKLLVSSLREFQNGLLGFFRYLNREENHVKALDDSSSDEFGMMAKVVNENINNTKEAMQKEKELIAEGVAVMSEFEAGDMSQRIDGNSSNPALNELKDVINKMGTTMESNINNILKVLEQYSSYNYMNKVDENGLQQHLLKLANGVNILGSSITQMLVENKTNGMILNNSAVILVNNMNTLSTNSNETAASLEETAAALEEITSTIISNTQNVAQISGVAKELTKSASEGENLAKDTMKSMEEINGQVESINEAISVIDQISFQTNILSLNAAVEAATAGEAGKGFAVVAQEVRNLASRSAEAAKEIKDLVENATKKASDGKIISSKMIEGYLALNENIFKTTELIDDVESSSREQQAGVEQINDAVTLLDQQTQQNASIASETQIVAQETDKIAELVVSNADKKEFEGKNSIDVTKTNKNKKPLIKEVPIKSSKKITKTDNQSKIITSNTDDDAWESF